MENRFWRKIRQRYHYSIILLKELVRTDFKTRYQGSVLGYLWSLLRPMFMFVILYFIFVYFLKIGAEIKHWPVALLFGMVMWSFFTEITNQGLKSVVSKGGVIRKINFPKYIIIVSTSFSAIINFLFNLIIIAIFMVINQIPFSWTWFLIPIFVAELYIFALGCAFFLSAIYVRYRDLNFIWEIIMQAMYYGAAVLFPMSRISNVSMKAAEILLLNPAAQALQDIRHALLPASMPPASYYFSFSGSWLGVVPFVLSVLILIVGAWFFRQRSARFAEEV